MAKFKWARSPEGVALVKQVGGDPSNKLVVHNASCGLHSNYPVCCVAFHTAIWMPTLWLLEEIDDSLADTFAYDYFASIAEVLACDMQDISQIGYVPCPNCLRTQIFAKTIENCGCYGYTGKKKRSRRKPVVKKQPVH